MQWFEFLTCTIFPVPVPIRRIYASKMFLYFPLPQEFFNHTLKLLWRILKNIRYVGYNSGFFQLPVYRTGKLELALSVWSCSQTDDNLHATCRNLYHRKNAKIGGTCTTFNHRNISLAYWLITVKWINCRPY